jgi:hypothetical protein
MDCFDLQALGSDSLSAFNDSLNTSNESSSNELSDQAVNEVEMVEVIDHVAIRKQVHFFIAVITLLFAIIDLFSI